MKKVFKLILFLVASINVLTAYGQNGKYDVRLVQKSFDFNPCLNEGTINIDIEVKAKDVISQFFIADQNYRFKFDTTILSNPQIVSELKLSGIIYGPGYSAIFAPHHLSGSLGDVISYNVVMNGGTGYPLSHKAFTKVGRLSFDISTTTSSQLQWLVQTDFPPTFIAEKVGGQIGTLYEATGYNFQSIQVDSLSGNPIPTRRNQNLHICSAQAEKIFEYSVKKGTSYDFKIEPQNAGRFVSDSIGVNHVHVVFDNPTVNNVKVIAGKSYPCMYVPHLEWAVQFDPNGVTPGDVNQDGYVDWSTDAIAQLYAKAAYYEYSQSFNHINSYYRPKDRFNVYQPFVYQHESYDYTCQYSRPWTADIGPLSFNLNGQLSNLKQADTNGDGILMMNTSTPGYQHTIMELGNIWGGPLDADIIVRNHHLKTAPHPGYSPGGPKNMLQIVPLDSTITPGQELRLLVNLGKTNFPVHDVQSIGFIVEFTYGSYKNPILNLGNSNLGNSNHLYVSDYPVLSQKTNPYWYIAIAREDLSGTSFSGQELCRITCEVTIAGLGNGPIYNKQGEIAINVHDVVIVNSSGQMTTIDGNSVTIPTSNPTKNSMLRTASGPDFHIFPNPATDLVTISYPPRDAGEQSVIKLLNTLGAVVKEQQISYDQNSYTSIQLDQLPAGIYFVELTIGKQSQIKRLVITD